MVGHWCILTSSCLVLHQVSRVQRVGKGSLFDLKLRLITICIKLHTLLQVNPAKWHYDNKWSSCLIIKKNGASIRYSRNRDISPFPSLEILWTPSDREVLTTSLRVPHHRLSGKIWKRVHAISTPKDSQRYYPNISAILWFSFIPDTFQQLSFSFNAAHNYANQTQIVEQGYAPWVGYWKENKSTVEHH